MNRHIDLGKGEKAPDWPPLGLSIVSYCEYFSGRARLTDGDSIEIALQDLAMESVGIAESRSFLVDLQGRSFHGGSRVGSPLAGRSRGDISFLQVSGDKVNLIVDGTAVEWGCWTLCR